MFVSTLVAASARRHPCQHWAVLAVVPFQAQCAFSCIHSFGQHGSAPVSTGWHSVPGISYGRAQCRGMLRHSAHATSMTQHPNHLAPWSRAPWQYSGRLCGLCSRDTRPMHLTYATHKQRGVPQVEHSPGCGGWYRRRLSWAGLVSGLRCARNRCLLALTLSRNMANA